MAWLASFGNALAKKNPFKINKMPRMARMARQKWRGGDTIIDKRGFWQDEKEKRE